MRHIRPFQLFTALKDSPAERIASVKIPARRDLWLIETFALITAMRLIGAKRIFEFGTFFGSTTLNLALNSPDDAEIFTFDLPRDEALAAVRTEPDTRVASERLAYGSQDFEGMPCASKIRQLTGNSREFDFSRFHNSIDLVFIDGGHDYETVKSDTWNALRMVKQGSPACIFWHDYRNPECPDNTAFLDELSREYDLTHIEETMLVFWFTPCDIRI